MQEITLQQLIEIKKRIDTCPPFLTGHLQSDLIWAAHNDNLYRLRTLIRFLSKLQEFPLRKMKLEAKVYVEFQENEGKCKCVLPLKYQLRFDYSIDYSNSVYKFKPTADGTLMFDIKIHDGLIRLDEVRSERGLIRYQILGMGSCMDLPIPKRNKYFSATVEELVEEISLRHYEDFILPIIEGIIDGSVTRQTLESQTPEPNSIGQVVEENWTDFKRD